MLVSVGVGELVLCGIVRVECKELKNYLFGHNSMLDKVAFAFWMSMTLSKSSSLYS